jgi:hypothetical protein
MTISNVGRGHVTFANANGPVLTWNEQKFWVEPSDIDRLSSARIGPDSSITIMVTFLGGAVGIYKDDARAHANVRDYRDVSVWTATVVRPGPQISGHLFGVKQVAAVNECTKNDSASYAAVIPVFNTGSSVFSVVDIKLIGADADDGVFVKDASDPATTIFPYQSVRPAVGADTHTLYQRILFKPRGERSYSATVRLIAINPLNNVVDSADAIITGTAIESHVTVNDVTFPTTEFIDGATVQQATMRVSALPTRPLTIERFELAPNDGEFAIVSPSSTPTTLAPGEFLDLAIEFRPMSPGDRRVELRVVGDHSYCDDSVGTITASTFKRDTVVTPPGRDTVGALTNDVDFGTVHGCSDAASTISLRNTGTTPIRVTSISLESGSPEFAATLPDLPLVVERNSTLPIPVRFTPGSEGTFNGSLRFEFIPEDGGDDSLVIRIATMTGVSERATASASIARGYRTLPGGRITVPVTLDAGVDASRVDDLVFQLRYAKEMMLADVDASSVQRFTDGTLLDGWNTTLIEHREDVAGTEQMVLSLRFTAPAGETLKGTGTLLNVDFKTFIGDAMETELPFTIVAPNRLCTEFATNAGYAKLDSICGLSLRLVEATAVAYALEQNSPNPFNPSTTLNFSVGLDGNTTLEIFDALGQKVATVVDTYLAPGHYSVTWDATSYPSGIYYYRLSSGVWSKTNVMMLDK